MNAGRFFYRALNAFVSLSAAANRIFNLTIHALF
jgi:hypothetical protein